MGGGGSSGGSSPQPYDLLGGAYSSFSGGTPSSGFNWGGFGQAIGGGLQDFGKSMQSGGGAIPQFGSTEPAPQSQIGTGAPYAQNSFIPQTNIDDAIMRILGGYG